MANERFRFGGFMIRLLVALVLVFASYNPSGRSWYHWVAGAERLDPLIALAGVVLLIGWVIYLRATFRSLGGFGTLLALALFGTLVWAMVDYGLLSLDNPTALSYVALVLLSAVLATGLSWSHIRRRLSGQIDVDEVDD